MRWQVVRSIHDLDEERWDSLAGVELTMSHRWHRVMEASRVGYCPRYLLAEDERGPLVGIVADANQSSGRSRRLDMLVRRLTLVVGAPFSSRHSGIVMRPMRRWTTSMGCWRSCPGASDGRCSRSPMSGGAR